MIFFTADCHLGHDKMYGRSFASIQEHDRTIVHRWNELVGYDDVVYVLGDFIWPGTDAYEYVERMNGKIFLIPGDHDDTKELPGEITVLPPLYEIKNTPYPPITLCHYPILRWRRSHYGAQHLYGHIHSGSVPQVGKSLCVSTDRNAYQPFSMTQIQQIMETLPQNPNLITRNDDGRQTAEAGTPV